MIGTEKQVTLAMDIQKEMLKEVDMQAMNHIIPMLRKADTQKKIDTMDLIKSKLTQDAKANNEMILETIRDIIRNEQSAVAFIENQSLLGFLIKYFG
jgi:hypothetical protein